MQGRFRSRDVPEFTREVPDPAPHEYRIDDRTYRLTMEVGGSSDNPTAVYDEVSSSKD